MENDNRTTFGGSEVLIDAEQHPEYIIYPPIPPTPKVVEEEGKGDPPRNFQLRW